MSHIAFWFRFFIFPTFNMLGNVSMYAYIFTYSKKKTPAIVITNLICGQSDRYTTPSVFNKRTWDLTWWTL